MKPEIKTTNKMLVIGVKGKCNMKTTMQDIPPLWGKLMSNKDSIQNIKNPTIAYGISTMIDKENFNSTACFEVESDDSIPENMVSESYEPMKVAVFLHKGKMEEMGKTYDDIMQKYIPEEKLEVAWENPCIEMYDERYIENSDESVCEIWMPIK